MNWTDELIKDLIACPKNLQGLNPKNKANSKHTETEGRAVSADGKHKFVIWNRIHIELAENFTWGLRYVTSQGRHIVLVRYNGDHGRHKNPDEKFLYGAHIHLITAKEIQRGLTEPEWAKPTDRYQFVHDAGHAFRIDLKVLNWGKYFRQEQERIPGEDWEQWQG